MTITEIGKTIGNWTILSAPPAERARYFIARCSCGIEKKVLRRSIRKGTSKSCGCSRSNLPYGTAAKNNVYKIYKNNAKTRNLDFSLIGEYFFDLIVKPCFYCGDKLSNTQQSIHSTGSFRYTGLDRVDNAQGYIVGNVVSCCFKCNKAKSIFTSEDFLLWVARVYNYSNLGSF